MRQRFSRTLVLHKTPQSYIQNTELRSKWFDPLLAFPIHLTFSTHESAERALAKLNYTILMGKPMRVMWCQKDSTLRRSGVGNLFIKNLDLETTNSTDLFELFSFFGKVLSCKFFTYKKGPKGYGYVQFESQEAANLAKGELDGKLLNGRKISVEHFKSCEEREAEAPRTSAKSRRTQDFSKKQKEGLDLYVKNLNENINDKYLQRKFSKFGTVTGAKVMMQNGRSRGYGFVRFLSAEDAMKAKEEINGTVWGEMKVFVDVAYWCKDHQDAPVHSDVKRTGRVQTRNMARRKPQDSAVEEELVPLLDPAVAEEPALPQDPTVEDGPAPPLDPAVEEEPAPPEDPTVEEEPASPQDGYVQFESQEAANLARVELDGKVLNERTISVEHFKSCEQHKAVTNNYTQGISDKQKEGMDLYVKNLDEHINHKYLQRKFSKFGTVTGAKVIVQDGRSRGYGFVRFLSAEDAMKAKEEINGTVWGKKKVFVDVADWCKDHQDAPVHSDVKRTGRVQREGLDLYVKNLDEHINHKYLQRKFSKFGTVTGAKVMMQDGRSRGFGFVRFSSAEDAMKAKEEINGTVWGEKKVFVDVAYWCKDHQDAPVHSDVKRTGRVQTRIMARRKKVQPSKKVVTEKPQDPAFEEVPVPPLDPSVEEEPASPLDPAAEEEPASSQDGYVQFKSQEAANLAKVELDGKVLNERTISVEHFKSCEQHKAVTNNYTQGISDKQKEGLDLYVKNLDEHINHKYLQRKFSKFGTVTGAKVMMQDGRSRGFGFVRFLSAEDAMKAKKEINGTVWGKKKVFVDVANWRKDHQDAPVHSDVKRTGRVQISNMAPRKPQDPAIEEEPVPLLDPPVAEEPALPQDPTVEEEPALALDPAVEEEPAPPLDPAVEEEPALDPAVKEEPAPPQDPTVEEEPAPAPVTAVEEEPAPALDPAVEEEPAPPQEPTVEEEPASPQEPTVEKEPASPQEPTVEEEMAPPQAEQKSVLPQDQDSAKGRSLIMDQMEMLVEKQ
ncbi:polyadenylate-binding protein 4 isoform X1 [Silurus asotus]|uniref:Polyadenylate-binding protein 4 isoform X1 n=1 Tax=Silurus asotus TaxID=30991 RepID=A0AAD5FLJ8_SILAS|nr:polyadenylate-binding protein 4 isoform X1 [Silurus asotus]